MAGELNPGDKLHLKYKYEIIGHLSDGGFGSVYEGKKLDDGKKVAIKLFKNDAFASEAECDMYWQRESKITEKQSKYSGRHMEYIEAKDDSNHGETRFFIVLGFVQGTTLKKWFNDNLLAPENQRMTVDDMIQNIFIPLCDYMDFCHKQGIVHRDFTFNNIMMIKDPKTGENYPITIDWGGGKEFDPAQLSQEPDLIENMQGKGTVIITPGFFAPEIILQKPPIPQTDIYMFGAVLFFSLTNGYTRVKPTIKSDYILHPQDYNMNISDTLNDIVEKCTQYEPKDRFRTFNEVKLALEQHMAGNVGGLDQLPTVATENTFVLRILNNNAIVQLKPEDMVLEEGKNIRVGRELMIESAPWEETYKGVFRGITRTMVNGKPRPREQFFLGYSKNQNIFYIHEGNNSNPTYLEGQRLPAQQWIPIQVNQQISIQSTTVRGIFELISVLDLEKNGNS